MQLHHLTKYLTLDLRDDDDDDDDDEEEEEDNYDDDDADDDNTADAIDPGSRLDPSHEYAQATLRTIL